MITFKRLVLVSIVCLLPSVASAALISFDANDNGNGRISSFGCVARPTLDQCRVEKTFVHIGPMEFRFLFDEPNVQTLTITEVITNATRVSWTDFHWSVDNSAVTFVSVTPILPFMNISGEGGTAVDIDGGVLEPFDSFSTTITLRVETDQLFVLTQIPTIDQTPGVPEPASLALLALGLGGLGFYRRRQA